jgi:hypothetical protein
MEWLHSTRGSYSQLRRSGALARIGPGPDGDSPSVVRE